MVAARQTPECFWRPPKLLKSLSGGRRIDSVYAEMTLVRGRTTLNNNNKKIPHNSRVFLAATNLTLESGVRTEYGVRVSLACYTGKLLMCAPCDGLPSPERLSFGDKTGRLEDGRKLCVPLASHAVGRRRGSSAFLQIKGGIHQPGR
ncbi:G-protein coupled receptor mth [Plakobranchus ocellatus]|uniref:G-protein coupled receptor mth n=1 Tax=Plakobranchus ocellatus TaxID=259542 RepID=A0AAV4D1L5_9GAST|nr:G-protein coupled receptor mth [Plakobranchus ocellatus]